MSHEMKNARITTTKIIALGRCLVMTVPIKGANKMKKGK
jgi:hypothetical protein